MMTAHQSISSQLILQRQEERRDSTFNTRSLSFYLSPNNEGESIIHLTLSLSHYCERTQFIGITIPLLLRAKCQSLGLCIGNHIVWKIPFSLLNALWPPRLSRDEKHWNYRIEPWMVSPESIPNMRIQLMRMIYLQLQLTEPIRRDLLQKNKQKLVTHWNHEYYRLGRARNQLLEHHDQIYRSYIERTLDGTSSVLVLPATNRFVNGFFLQTATPWEKIWLQVNQGQTILYEWTPESVDCMGERKPGWRWTPAIQNCLEKYLYPNLVLLVQEAADNKQEWFYWIPLSFGNHYTQWTNTESFIQLNQFKEPVEIAFDCDISGTLWLNAFYTLHSI